jgi:hypothetical protein
MAQAAMTAPLATKRRTRSIGIVLPVHDEEELLDAALEALEAAVAQVIEEVPCHTVLVFDECRDRSRKIAATWRRGLRPHMAAHLVTEIEIDACNVGSARRAGCATVLSAAASFNIPPASTWLATTDADSTVPEHWLSSQLLTHDAGTDVWSGTVTVHDWMHRRDGTAARWRHDYESESKPAHGASLGINGQVYLDAGQFEELASGEDRSLLSSATMCGARCFFDRSAPVTTSARHEARAPHGFAHALWRIEEQIRLGSHPPAVDAVSV